MNIHSYLSEHFPGNELNGGLYFDWPVGLHFELAAGIYQFNTDGSYNEEMFKTAIRDALYVIDEVIGENDELYVLLDVFHHNRYNKTRLLTDYMISLFFCSLQENRFEIEKTCIGGMP